MSILIKPVITEKATANSELNNRYTFVVDPSANKIQIKQAVEQTYGVTVEGVRTLNYAPKRITRYTKKGIQQGKKTNATKRAVVSVKEGDTIDFFSNI